jgi:hypothetical protein
MVETKEHGNVRFSLGTLYSDTWFINVRVIREHDHLSANKGIDSRMEVKEHGESALFRTLIHTHIVLSQQEFQ